ncbi:hypothetical protein FDECE_2982 [Fusarium decemcellulare]|nr:hypothetical protein FDECE_2982 [Fusarium decemcellulare]
MEVALTFGSVGDIIALCQLAAQLGRAVGVGGGDGESVKEYQQLRQDLDLLVRILVEVMTTLQQYEESEELKTLNDAAKSVVDQCASLMQETLDRIQPRYCNSLRPEGPGSKMKDQGERQSTVFRRSTRIDHATMLTRFNEIQTLVSKACNDQVDMLNLIRQANEDYIRKFDEVDRQLVKQDEQSRRLVAMASEALCAIFQVKGLLIRISEAVTNIEVAFNSMYLRPIDPTKELPVTLEDSLGRQFPIAPELLSFLGWETFYSLVSDSFKDQDCHGMVMRREYALEDSASGKDLNPDRPLPFCLRRGMKVNMSMIFQTAYAIYGACPRCVTAVHCAEGVTVQCPRSDCSMWFQEQRTGFALPDDIILVSKGPESGEAIRTLVEPADF